MRHEIRVIFGDTDQMGVVYYANYLRFFEGARAEYWRSLGRSYKDLEAAQIAMPVIEAHVVSSTEAPGGSGEISTPPVAPAIANAIFAATGKRLRKLPIRNQDLA